MAEYNKARSRARSSTRPKSRMNPLKGVRCPIHRLASPVPDNHHASLDVVPEGFQESKSELFKVGQNSTTFQDKKKETEDTCIGDVECTLPIKEEINEGSNHSSKPFVRRPLKRHGTNESSSHRSLSITSLMSMPSLSSIFGGSFFSGSSHLSGSSRTFDTTSTGTSTPSPFSSVPGTLHIPYNPEHEGKVVDVLELSIRSDHQDDSEKEERRWDRSTAPQKRSSMDLSPVPATRKSCAGPNGGCTTPPRSPKRSASPLPTTRTGCEGFNGSSTAPPKSSYDLSMKTSKDSAPILAARKTSSSSIVIPDNLFE